MDFTHFFGHALITKSEVINACLQHWKTHLYVLHREAKARLAEAQARLCEAKAHRKAAKIDTQTKYLSVHRILFANLFLLHEIYKTKCKVLDNAIGTSNIRLFSAHDKPACFVFSV